MVVSACMKESHGMDCTPLHHIQREICLSDG